MARKAKSGEVPVLDAPLPRTLMEAIAAAPHEDAPRLVAADWFEEHGQPERGELIAVQCNLERLDAASPEREQLEARMHELLRDLRPGWKPNIFNVEVGLVRGFAGTALGEPGDLLAASQQLAELALPVQRVALNSLGDTRALEKLVGTPFWAGVRVLHLSDLDDLSAAALFGSGKLGQLEHLLIERSGDLDRSSWALLARSDALPRLRSLRLSYANAAQWIRAQPALPALEVLGLEKCELKHDDLKRLTRAPAWQRLQTLVLHLTPLFAEGGAVIATAAPPSLRALDLSWCQLGAPGLRALARSEGLQLSVLKLRHNALTGPALAQLIDAPCAARLEWLDARGNPKVDARTLEELRQRFPHVLA